MIKMSSSEIDFPFKTNYGKTKQKICVSANARNGPREQLPLLALGAHEGLHLLGEVHLEIGVDFIFLWGTFRRPISSQRPGKKGGEGGGREGGGSKRADFLSSKPILSGN